MRTSRRARDRKPDVKGVFSFPLLSLGVSITLLTGVLGGLRAHDVTDVTDVTGVTDVADVAELFTRNDGVCVKS